MGWALSYVPYAELQRLLGLRTDAIARARLYADACRLNTLYMIMRAGSGHIGSSFSAMDIVTWLHLEELGCPRAVVDEAGDIYFSSKGHDAPGLYAVLLGLGKLDFSLIHHLRRLGGLPGHPDIETPGIVTNTGSLGMGVSKAKGIVTAERLSGRPTRVFVLTGDGELQEGQFWESLQGAANMRMGEITVIVDHNKMQSDTWVERVSPLGSLESKFASFGWHVERCDGHDLGAFGQVLERLRTIREQPKVVIADTIKGKGVSLMENVSLGEDELYRFHSGAPSAENYEAGARELAEKIDRQLRLLGELPLTLAVERIAARKQAGGQRLVAAYSSALVDIAGQNSRVVALDADLVLDCGLIPFKERYPERFIECGIAEQDMVSQAGALALRGYIPVVHSFACFLSTRPNEQIYNNATERTRIVYVGSLAGLVPGGPGHSHQSVRDISALAAIPGLELVEPCSADEVRMALDYAVNSAAGSVYLRLVSVPVEVPFALPPNYRLAAGQGVTIRDGTDCVIVGYGPVLLAEAWKAADILRETQGLSVKLINLPWLNTVDPVWLERELNGFASVVSLDNHYVVGGQGDTLAGVIAQTPALRPMRLVKLGVASVPTCGLNDEILRYHNLDAEGIAQAVAGRTMA